MSRNRHGCDIQIASIIKKKKYAALKITSENGGVCPEIKGLDVVRRDWAKLASETGKIKMP
uniref:DNA-directed DNA polymerase n=1 Tax=Strigamia maritima TaxID=126957 RepID=T1JM99_STRMM